MGLDSFTIKNLEIFNSLLNQGQHGTLIDAIDCTLTSGGGRLLRNWLINPITELDKINARLDFTDSFLNNKNLLNNIRDGLLNAADIQRILGKISTGKSSPREIIALARTLEKINYQILMNYKIRENIKI